MSTPGLRDQRGDDARGKVSQTSAAWRQYATPKVFGYAAFAAFNSIDFLASAR